VDENGPSRSRYDPEYEWNGKKMDIHSLSELFKSGDLAAQFAAFFPTLNEENWEKVIGARSFNQKDMPYSLCLENNSGYLEDCHFCGNRSCRANCPCPYTTKMTVLDLLHKIGVEDNLSFYGGGSAYKLGKQDVIFEMIWQTDFEDNFIKQLSGMSQAKFLDGFVQEIIGNNKKITLNDCFDQFRTPEMLDENNKWYCNKCKDHVRATKQMEIFKAPPIMIVSLKRFRTSASQSRFYGMYTSSAGTSKIDDHVEFPLEGLDMTDNVIGWKDSDERLIYDCYAVSNHMGGLGGGHYTAYGKNALDDQWYSFNDSNCSQLRGDPVDTVVRNCAYNLFYRRRDWHE
jgi:hypothetical protein